MWKEVNIDGDRVLGLECDGKLSKGIVTLTRVRWQRWIFFVVATHEYDCQLQAPPFSARDHHARGLALCAFQPLPTRGRGNTPEPWRRRFL